MKLFGRLYNIEHGNVCALCEHNLNWMYGASDEDTPIAHTIHRAICKPCFETLKKKYNLVKRS